MIAHMGTIKDGVGVVVVCRLGGEAWQRRRAKLKERIREIADRLMRIAAERALRHAPILEAPHSLWEAFAARFPWQETDHFSLCQ
jgi:transcription-repair coupling factor (superfamily II helicase)